MKVLEHSAFRLVLLDGAIVYSYGTVPSASNLIIQPLIVFIICTFVVSWFPGSSIRLALILGSMMAALPFISLLLVRAYGGGRYSMYSFDKQTGTLTCSKPAVFPYCPPTVTHYNLDKIIAVEPVTYVNDDPPPAYWRFIELRMVDKTIKLHPGLDQGTQEHMTDLICNFIFND